MNLSISNGTISTKIYDKRDDFDFDIVNFPFLDGDVPRRTSYCIYISQLFRFAMASSNVRDFNCRNKALTAKLLKHGYRSRLIAGRRVRPHTQWQPRHKAFTSAFGPDTMSVAWPAVVHPVIFFNSGLQWGIRFCVFAEMH